MMNLNSTSYRRLLERQPIEGPWQQESITSFLKDYQSNPTQRPRGNPESKENDGCCSVLPYIAAIATVESDLSDHDFQTIRSLASLLSSNEVSLGHTLLIACVLHRVIRTDTAITAATMNPSLFLENLRNDVSILVSRSSSSLTANKQVLQDILEEIGIVEEAYEYLISKRETLMTTREDLSKGEKDKIFLNQYLQKVDELGKACANPGSFMNSLLAVLLFGEDGYCTTIRMIVRSGGCNCSRSNIVGAIVGAVYGIFNSIGISDTVDETRKSIPFEWIQQTDGIVEILEKATNIVDISSR
jgi:hypothetical protein